MDRRLNRKKRLLLMHIIKIDFLSIIFTIFQRSLKFFDPQCSIASFAKQSQIIIENGVVVVPCNKVIESQKSITYFIKQKKQKIQCICKIQ